MDKITFVKICTIRYNPFKIIFYLNLLQTCLALQDFCTYVEYAKRRNVSTCQNDICNRTFTITYISQMQFYNSEKVVDELIDRCCGKCGKINSLKRIKDISYLDPRSNGSSDFIFPVLAEEKQTRKYGYYFIPYVDMRSAMYITKDTRTTALSNILKLYPLVIIVLFLAIISGFVIWVFETKKNKEQFPGQFLHGWFEGFWWSFVTMTTVGYGDRTPTTVGGKFYTIIWILIGIVTCGIITGSLTNEILQANTPPPPSMKGKSVGMLKYRDFDGFLIANEGGIPVEFDGKDFTVILFKLIESLRKDEIDGILFDKYTLWYINWVMARYVNFIPGKTHDDLVFFLNKTIRTEKIYDNGPLMAYGILAKYLEDYNYFRFAIIDNHYSYERKLRELWANELRNGTVFSSRSFYSSTSILFSPEERYFRFAAIAMGATIGLIVMIGFGYQLSLQSLKKVRLTNPC